jgi:nitroreductase
MNEHSTNTVIHTLLNRRSIRHFAPEPIDPDIVDLLERAAQQAASSQFLNDWSAIRITDDGLKRALADIGNQDYIAQAPLLYVFVVDEHRNLAIARHAVDGVTAGGDTTAAADSPTLNVSYRYIQGQNDATLALQSMETAANALGLGCVILGSVLNDANRLIELLHLPELTYPVLALAIGKPAESPALKPRMPRRMQFFDNAYPGDDATILESVGEFDATLHHYYDLRHADRPVGPFSDQIAKASTDEGPLIRPVAPIAARQGFDLSR